MDKVELNMRSQLFKRTSHIYRVLKTSIQKNFFDYTRPQQWVGAIFSTSKSRRHNESVREAVFAGLLSMFRTVIDQIFKPELTHIRVLGNPRHTKCFIQIEGYSSFHGYSVRGERTEAVVWSQSASLIPSWSMVSTASD